jgi:DNA invertase Pin-like site-specific DNA recombinase
MAHLLGYARISTAEQHPDLQVDALKAAGCYRVFVDTASGALAARPALDQVLDQLRPGDTLMVWKLDRLGRSLRHLVDTIAALADRGIGFRSLQESIDTTTPGGKLVFHIFAALAEFERDLIRERTTAGLAAARARGRAGGRPAVMTQPKIRLAREMYASRQYTVAAIASTLGVSRASIYRHLDDLEGESHGFRGLAAPGRTCQGDLSCSPATSPGGERYERIGVGRVGRSRGKEGAMEQAEIDRVRRALRRRPKPAGRVLWRGRPHRLQVSGRNLGPWARRRPSWRRVGSCCGRRSAP